MAKKPNEIYVERRPDGDYSVTRPNAERASAITQTQAQAIERAGEIAPELLSNVVDEGWPQAATFNPSLNSTPATTSGSNTLPLSFLQFF